MIRILKKPPRVEPDAYWAHRYFTDGNDLFRLIGYVHGSVGQVLAEFENCASLEIALVRVDRPTRGRLRPVATVGVPTTHARDQLTGSPSDRSAATTSRQGIRVEGLVD
jgi:hypothetical protein